MATWPKGVHDISSIMPKYPTMGGFFCHVFMGEKKYKTKVSGNIKHNQKLD